jgi:DNA-binding transcriptional LysR family regulator
MPRSTYQQQRADGDGYHQEADMSVSLDLLRTFLAVYRHGSITAAAERVGLSQPAMTAQVKSLETRLDRQLFVRQARGMAPTPAADDLARAVAGPLDSLARAVDDDTDPFARAVLLGGPAELLTEVALPLLAPLVGEGLRLRVSFGLADDLLNALSAGRLDLVVSTVPPRRRGVRAEPAYDESFVLVGAPGQSTDAPMIAYAEDLPIIRRYWRLVYGMRPPMSAQVVVPDLRAVLTLVLRGAGISVLPSYLCTTHLDAGRLVPLARPDLAPINTGYVAWRHGALTHPAVAAVHAHLLERLRQM